MRPRLRSPTPRARSWPTASWPSSASCPRYLPDPLSADEVGEMVTAAVARAAEQGASGRAAMGRVMKELSTADGGALRRRPARGDGARSALPEPARSSWSTGTQAPRRSAS